MRLRSSAERTGRDIWGVAVIKSAAADRWELWTYWSPWTYRVWLERRREVAT